MNREELKRKLDVDGNNKVNFEDVIKFVDGDDRKLFGFGALVGAIPGLIAGVILGAKMF